MTDAPTDAAPQALLVMGFGGPEAPEEVMPFLRRVVAGRGVPDERLVGVAEHYHQLGGRSPINDQCRALIEALRPALGLPIYWGNLNWRPELLDAVRTMADDGISEAAVFVTSGFGSPPGCRRYQDALAAARDGVEGAPAFRFLPLFGAEPGFRQAVVDRVRDALADLPRGRLVFTAHSVPTAMSEASPYVAQLRSVAASIAAEVGRDDWDLVYQSRSGPPRVPWLEPDVCDHITALGRGGVREAVVIPLGFVSDHVEVLWDLDREAADAATAAGVRMVRAGTVGTHPAFVSMIVDQVRGSRRRACAPGCCTGFRPGPRRGSQPASGEPR